MSDVRNTPEYQKWYDEFQERWGAHYSNGDDCCDAACEYAEAKVKDPTLDVEDFGVDA